MELSVVWNGHSCFSLTCDGYTVVCDPYRDGAVPGLEALRLTGHEVLCSHAHGDHHAPELVTRLPRRESPFRVTAIPTWHDPEEGRLRGPNTIHLLECGDFRIAHFGDLGAPLAEDALAALCGLDVAMVPVGGYYTIGPEEAAALLDALHPRIVFPMHYRGGGFGFPVLATVEDFLALRGGGAFYRENHRTVTKESPAEISVLRYLGSTSHQEVL